MPPRFRKSKPPADIPVSIPAPPVHLVENLGSRKDSRTLAALSAAIALSIGSASHNISETSSDNATVQEKDTGWRTAYGAAKMTVELTKESSDMFLPLKAVASAISVLIKNYDVGLFPPFIVRTFSDLLSISHSSKHRIMRRW